MTEPNFASIKELLEARVAEFADKEFLFSEADNRVFTYKTFDEAVNRAVALLRATGVGKGDCVSLFLTNSADYLIAYFACFKLGAWAGPVNAHLKSAEVEFIIANSAASVVITQSDLYAKIAEVQANLPSLHHVVVVGGQWSVVGGQGSVVSGQGAGVRDQNNVDSSLITHHSNRPLTTDH
jgi:acyl-CoA synthetase (AMP-forming)/AMP-acid ligase II